jgi:hypothetical protein
MKVVQVETPHFSGELLHISEVPKLQFGESRFMGLYGEVFLILEAAIRTDSKREELLDLTTSQAIEVWNVYRVSEPKEVPDAMS